MWKNLKENPLKGKLNVEKVNAALFHFEFFGKSQQLSE